MNSQSDSHDMPAVASQASELSVLTFALAPVRRMLWAANLRERRNTALFFVAQVGMLVLCAIPYLHWPTVKAGALLVPYTPWAIFGAACPFVMIRFLAKKRQARMRVEMQDLMDMMRAFYRLPDAPRTDLSWFSKVTWNACPLLSDELDQCQSITALPENIRMGELMQLFAEQNKLSEFVEIGKAITVAEENDDDVSKVLEKYSVELSQRWLRKMKTRRWLVGIEMTFITIVFIMPLMFMPIIGPAAMPILRALPGIFDANYYDHGGK